MELDSGGWMDSKLLGGGGGGAEGVFLDFDFDFLEFLEVASSFLLLLLAEMLPFIRTVSLESFSSEFLST